MGEATGIPLGAAVGLLPGSRPGVATPETLLEPADFYAALAPHCVGSPRPEEVTVTTRSWDPQATAHLDGVLGPARSLLL
ncbi:hypothetical protein [Streptomyces sp. NPDC007264]|uniref:hypothetical protein n=1 Tax=Streptomyces sp. NPDC007264 TaxID=3364777 RepID=UPI0036DF7A71